MSEKHKTDGGVPTTGHLWDDDLADYVNQPPKWWMIGLTASALWVVVYWLIYPSVPVSLAGDHWKGLNIFNGVLHIAAKFYKKNTHCRNDYQCSFPCNRNLPGK